MVVRVKLGDVIPPDMLAEHRQHITDFLLQEGITADPHDLAETTMTERQVKELLEELASDIEH